MATALFASLLERSRSPAQCVLSRSAKQQSFSSVSPASFFPSLGNPRRDEEGIRAMGDSKALGRQKAACSFADNAPQWAQIDTGSQELSASPSFCGSFSLSLHRIIGHLPYGHGIFNICVGCLFR